MIGLLDGAADTIGVWLLRTSLEATVLIALVLLARFVFARQLAARARYALWMLVVVRLAMPVAPPSRFSVFNLLPAAGRVSWAPAGGEAAARGASSPPSSPAAPSTRPDTRRPRPRTIVFTGWAMVATLLLARVAVRSYRLTARVGRQRPVTRPDVIDLLEDSKQQLRVHVPMNVVQSSEVSSPALLGFLRPRLLLPDRLVDAFDHASLRLLFLHELAHAKRRDILVNWAATLVHVVHWFNPLVAIALARMRCDRELATDSLVLRGEPEMERRRYGETLIRLLEFAAQPGLLPGAVGVLEDKADLKRRMVMIAHHRREHVLGSALAVGLFLVLACTTLTAATGGRDAAAVTAEAETFDTAPAVSAAESWWALLDRAEFGQSWEDASSTLRAAITRADWEKRLVSARTATGRLLSRRVKAVEHRSSLPGAPDGEYVVIETDAAFEKLPAAVETAVMTLEAGGEWRAAGYFVRPKGDVEAERAAQAWLTLVDVREYGRSWEEAAPRFRAAVSRADWETAVLSARGGYGKLLSRTIRSTVAQKSLPGLPPGTFAIVQTQASFEHKKSATETCTLEQLSDGQWRVVGYFVR